MRLCATSVPRQLKRRQRQGHQAMFEPSPRERLHSGTRPLGDGEAETLMMPACPADLRGSLGRVKARPWQTDAQGGPLFRRRQRQIAGARSHTQPSLFHRSPSLARLRFQMRLNAEVAPPWAYQSGPRTSPPLGVQASHQVAAFMEARHARPLPSAKQVSMASCAVCPRYGLHWARLN